MLLLQNGLSEAVIGREFMATFGGSLKDSQEAFPQDEDNESYGTFGPAIKSVSLQQHGTSFGFTLRHFVIYPPDLLHNSNNEASRTNSNGLDKTRNHTEEVDMQKTEPMDVVFIRQVSPNSSADKAGLSTGDQIISVNKDSVIGKSYNQVVQLIQDSQDLLELGVVPKEDCMLQLVTPSYSDMPASTSNIAELKYKWPASHSSSSVISTATVTPSFPGSSGPAPRASSVRLKLAENSSPQDHASTSSLSSVSLRRNSVDRAAQENRGFVITGISHTLDNNSNHLPRKGNSVGSCSLTNMNGSYFVAATDSTGRARALHFEKGASSGSSLSVVDDPKARSVSLTTEPRGHVTQQDKKLSLSIRDQTLSHTNCAASNVIPQFSLSAPRTYSSDGLSTSYLSTNSDSGARQPVASDAGFNKGRTTIVDSTEHLSRVARASQDRPTGLKSSTVCETLLESRPDELNGDGPPSPDGSSSELFGDSSQAARQSDDFNEQAAFSSQMSVFPKKPSYEEVIFSQSDPGETSAGPKTRRISYLMATAQGGGRSATNQNASFVFSHGPQKSSHFPPTSAASNLQPMMVHVSSGMELCEDTSVTSENSCSQEEQGDNEGTEKELYWRGLSRRTSYVIATSSPTSPRVLDSLAAMQEENEEVFEEAKEGVPGLSEVSKEGLLFRKVAIVDGGKRSNARSWKPVNAVLRGHVLYLQKDKTHSHQGESSSDEQPVSIKSCIVDIAHDYTKRKNVFRVTTFNGSEFLFQAEDHGSMMSWISAIQANNNPDEDENGVTSESVIIRRIRNVEHETAGSTTPAVTYKLSPPTSTKIIAGGITNLKKSLSFKNITVGQKDKGENTKNHWHKSNKKKKKTAGSAAGINSFAQGHSVGAPLEDCLEGSYKSVPLIVEHCCDVVEQRGLETVGVYRVPGNAASVTALQEEINSKGADNINFEEEKWNDVNNMTSLLKQFLRKLPEGLVTADLYDNFLEANRKESPVERMLSLKSWIQELPEPNFETLKLLMTHLKLVSENCEKNKMEARNLAIVFGPTLVRTGEDTMMSLVRDMSDQCRIVESLLIHCDWFFDDREAGNDTPPKPPPVTDLPQEHTLSETVFSSLGQAAVSFGDDGSLKSKGGMLLQFPKFPRGKRKSDAAQVSSPETSTTSDAPGSGENSPTVERAQITPSSPIVERVQTTPIPTSDSSRSNSPTQEKPFSRTGYKRSGDQSPVGAPHVSLLEMMESRPKGKVSLKAYSFSLPPPPIYRPQNQKKATSPSEYTAPTENENVPKPDEEPLESEANPTSTLPKFETLTEGTRLRLLRLNLLQRADEKKRLQKEKELGATQTESRSESSSGDLSPEAHRANRKLSDAEDSASSSSTSRSSSTPSSKNPSLDSLHLHGADREGSRNVQSPAARNLPRTSGDSRSCARPPSPHHMMQSEDRVLSHETRVVIPHGIGAPISYACPCGPDLHTRHEGVRSVGSDSTESSSEDEEEGECALSLSKTFDEKLKFLIDLDYKFSSEGRHRNSVKEQDDDVSSVSSEPQRRLSTNHDTDVPSSPKRRPSEQIINYESNSQEGFPGDAGFLKKSSTDEASTSMSSITSSASRKSSFSNEMRNCESGVRTNSLDPGPETLAIAPKSEAAQFSSHEVKKREVTGEEVKSEKRLTPRRSVPSAAEIRITLERSRQRNAAKTRRSLGSVRTTTPVELKEFDIREVAVKKNPGNPRRVNSVQQNTNPKPALRIVTSAPASSWRPGNMSLSSSHKHGSGSAQYDAGRPQPIIFKSRATGNAGNRDSGPKARLLSQKAASRDLLPSKARGVGRGTSKVVPTEKLEKNAQHIAELLEEMHSERHLKMNRQRSDISGDAQKTAAQRAWRRRRRSLGNDEAVLATRLDVSTDTVAMETQKTGMRYLEARDSSGYRNEMPKRGAEHQHRSGRAAYSTRK